MSKFSTSRLEKCERISRARREGFMADRTMTLIALDADDLASLRLLSSKQDISVSELCAAIIQGWLNSGE